MQDPTHDDLVYAAAIIDGEGSICLSRTQNFNRKKIKYYTYMVRVVVGNTNSILTDWLHSLFGGKLKFYKRYGKNKDFYLWQLTTKDEIQIFLTKVRPYIKLKIKQVDSMFEYLEMFQVNDPSRRQVMWEAMSALNKKGKPVETITQDTSDLEVKIESELHGDV